MWYTTRKVRIQKHILLLSLSTKKQTHFYQYFVLFLQKLKLIIEALWESKCLDPTLPLWWQLSLRHLRLTANWTWQGRPGRRKFRPCGRKSRHSMGNYVSWSTLCAVSHAAIMCVCLIQFISLLFFSPFVWLFIRGNTIDWEKADDKAMLLCVFTSTVASDSSWESHSLFIVVHYEHTPD